MNKKDMSESYKGNSDSEEELSDTDSIDDEAEETKPKVLDDKQKVEKKKKEETQNPSRGFFGFFADLWTSFTKLFVAAS